MRTVSVVIVCHNDLPHLELAIDSALCQTHREIDVVVVDNGSSDGTEAFVAKRYRARVRYIRQANVGAAGGRNTGLNAATGDYIQLLDGDDFLAPNKIERQLAAFDADPSLDVAVGRFRSFRSTCDVPGEMLFDCDTPDGGDFRARLIDRCPGPPIAFLFRRRVVETIGLQQVRLYNEDYEYWLRAAFGGMKFGLTPDAYGFYRKRAGQKSQHRWRIALADYAVYQYAKRYIAEEPYRSLLLEKVARLEHTFAHYFLNRGDGRRAGRLLQKLRRTCPPSLPFGRRRTTQWLAAAPGGPTVYAAIRRLKGLAPPFTVDPEASRRLALAGG